MPDAFDANAGPVPGTPGDPSGSFQPVQPPKPTAGGGLTVVHPSAAAPPPPAESPDNPGTADNWIGQRFNAPNTAGFDAAKPTASRDQFGEWSVDDTNNAPQKQFSPQQLEDMFTPKAKPQSNTLDTIPPDEKPYLSDSYSKFAIGARQAGYSWDDINQYIGQKVQDFRTQAKSSNYSDDEINSYLGLTGDQVTRLTATVKQQAIDHFTQNPPQPDPTKDDGDNIFQAFWNGISHSTSGIAGTVAVGHKDQLTLAKQYPDVFRGIAQSFGYALGGAAQAGAVGATMGAEIGGIGGTAVEPGGGTILGGGLGTVIGGIIGFGVGLTADGAVRSAAADYVKNGDATNIQDFGSRYVMAWYNGAKEALPAVAGAAVAGPAGAAVAKAGGGQVLQWGTKIASQVAAMTAVAAGINQRVPTAQDWVDSAIAVAAFEVAGVGAGKVNEITGTAPKPTKPGNPNIATNDQVSQAAASVLDNYVNTGELPNEIVPRIAAETSIDGLVARDTASNGKIENEVEIRKAWEDQGVADFSPATRARWFASAVDDGVEAAGTLLERSAGDPGLFNRLRGALLKKDYEEDPDQYGGNLTQYLQRMDSRPPEKPEPEEDPSAIIEKLSIPGGYQDSVAAHLNRQNTSTRADMDQLLKLGKKMAPALKQPPKDGSFQTLNEKFEAHRQDPEGTPLTPEETKIFMAKGGINEFTKVFQGMRSRIQGYLDEKDAMDPAQGDANPLPFFTHGDLAKIVQGAGKGAFENLSEGILRLGRVVRAKETFDAIKNDPVFKSNSAQAPKPAKVGETPEPFEIPKGYRQVPAIPQLRGIYMDPKIAEPLEDFLKGGPSTFDVSTLEKLNSLSIGALFTLDPGGILGHARNLFETLIAARGFDNLTKNPKPLRAIDEVWNFGPSYIEALRAGGRGILSSGIREDSTIVAIMKAMGQSMAKDTDRWGPTIKKLGLNGSADFMRAWSNGISKELYRFGDVLYMQRYMELRDKGYTPEQAVKETELFMPSYSIPTRVPWYLGGRTASQLLGAVNITAFGRYEVAKYTAIANAVKTLVSSKSSVEGRVAATGRLFVTAMMMTAGQYMMDHLMKTVTGNPDAQWLWGGPLGIVEKGAKAVLAPSQEHFSALLSTAFTPSPIWYEAVQQLSGKDFFTGKDIVPKGTNPVGDVAFRLDHAIHGLNFGAPFDLADGLVQAAQDPAGAPGRLRDYLLKTVGLSRPSPVGTYFADGGMTRSERREGYIERAKAPAWVQFMSGP